MRALNAYGTTSMVKIRAALIIGLLNCQVGEAA